MDRSRHSRGLPRLCTLRQRCRQSPQRSSRVPNRSMWMIMYSSVSSTLVTVCAFSPSCFLINVSTSTSILFLSMAVNNSPQRIRCSEVSSPGQPAVKLLEPNHFSSNYTFGTGTEKTGHKMKRADAMQDTAFRTAFEQAKALLRVLSASLRSRDDGANSWEIWCGGV